MRKKITTDIKKIIRQCTFFVVDILRLALNLNAFVL